MKYLIMNGTGNRFAIINARKLPFVPSEDFIRRLTRQDASGFDQIIAMETADKADVFMRIWNSDGSEVSACGNATRCVADIIMREKDAMSCIIETRAGILRGQREETDMISIDMGKPRLNWQDIPLAEELSTTKLDLKIGPVEAPFLHSPAACSMGNPHVTFFVEDIESLDVPNLGALIEWHPLFPEGVNVGFAQVIRSSEIRLRVWERGTGLTKACGTGACAAIVNTSRRRLTGRQVKVIVDGGRLHINWREDDHVIMTGPIEYEGMGEFEA